MERVYTRRERYERDTCPRGLDACGSPRETGSGDTYVTRRVASHARATRATVSPLPMSTVLDWQAPVAGADFL